MSLKKYLHVEICNKFEPISTPPPTPQLKKT